MNDEAVQAHDQLAANYLQQLQALAFEISVAMDAIARNAITSFQESVAKQEMLCAVLANLANTIGERVSSGRAAAAFERQFRRTKNSRDNYSDPRPQFTVCRAPKAFRKIDRSSRFAVQKSHRTTSGGWRVQVETSDLVLRDVTYVIDKQRTLECRTIPAR